MIKEELAKMVKGWFVGNFLPTLHNTNQFEVAVKKYKKGDNEPAHFHKIATEITVIIEGRAKFNDEIITRDQIVVVQPGEVINFCALEDCSTVVVKFPSVTGDKFII
jgi:mannose-6-phosphate isomerase-like protein (cupin superfamily)